MSRFKVIFLLLLSPMIARGDVESGPKVDEKIPELKAYAIMGLAENKEIDFAKERKDEVTVYAFVQREHFGRPMFRFLRNLDMSIREIDEKIHVVIVFLGDDADKNKEYLNIAQKSFNLVYGSLAVYTGEKAGPNGWGLNSDAHITVTVANKGKVIANTAYTTINETDADKVKETLKKAVKK